MRSHLAQTVTVFAILPSLPPEWFVQYYNQ